MSEARGVKPFPVVEKWLVMVNLLALVY